MKIRALQPTMGPFRAHSIVERRTGQLTPSPPTTTTSASLSPPPVSFTLIYIDNSEHTHTHTRLEILCLPGNSRNSAVCSAFRELNISRLRHASRSLGLPVGGITRAPAGTRCRLTQPLSHRRYSRNASLCTLFDKTLQIFAFLAIVILSDFYLLAVFPSTTEPDSCTPLESVVTLCLLPFGLYNGGVVINL